MTRYWVGVACRDHVKQAEAGGFIQLGHGREEPLRRPSPGDGLVCYATRSKEEGGHPVSAFVAIGRVGEGEVRQADGQDAQPFRRDMTYAENVREAPVRLLLHDLGFVPEGRSWGLVFRRSLFEIARGDFLVIARAMEAADDW
ncbi:EVE domain-containing protein [Aquicoccus sp. SCR17]|nr:EVE domain-containing protein [Carideicomes alvinocaridis]